jgi:tRNA-specific 2-thiouridylase
MASKKIRVVVGLSGGVDSSVAALLLKEQGHDVIGLYMINWHETTGLLHGDCPRNDDIVFAELVAKKIGIPFEVVDLSAAYSSRVVDYLFAEYSRGRTPNPDVLCNREIKFDAFLKVALEKGADKVATGHYCQTDTVDTPNGPMHRLLAGADTNKDQSYFLCQVSQSMLRQTLFPIGHLNKPEVRELAQKYDLATAARKDSQGICFVGKVDLPVFLQQKLSSRTGPIIEIPAENILVRHRFDPGYLTASDPLEYLCSPQLLSPEMGRKVGEHSGAHFFTLGQRKGLLVGGMKEPLFVIGIDVVNKILFVGQGEQHPGLFRQGLRMNPAEMHWVRPDIMVPPGQSHLFQARIRYRQPLQTARLISTEANNFLLFENPQRSITPGQFAALYQGNELVASGVIE